MMSGGDLDGDQFAVFWDCRLVKFAANFRQAPLDYLAPPKQSPSSGDLIEHLFTSEQTILGRIDALFWRYASAEGITSKKCEQLALIFSRAVDKLPNDAQALDELERRAPQVNDSALWVRLEKKQAVRRELCSSENADDFWATFRSSNCWESIPCEVVGSAIAPSISSELSFDIRPKMMKHAVAKFHGIIACSCHSARLSLVGARVACKFNCEDAWCGKTHPSPEAAAAQWRALAEKTLTEEAPSVVRYHEALGVVQGIIGRLFGPREAVKRAEEELDADRWSAAARHKLDSALDSLAAASSGSIWRKLNERALAKEGDLASARAGVQEMAKQSKVQAACLAQTKWMWSSARPLRGPFDQWLAWAKVKVLRRRLEEKKARSDKLRKQVLEEKQEIEAERDEHFSEDALLQAKAALQESAVSIQGLDVALRSFSSRVARLLLQHGVPEDWLSCNRELQLALGREKRRLTHVMPVYAYRAAIVEKLRKRGAVVVTAGTGSGKSTQIPGYLVDDLDLQGPVVCTQPRRVAAKSLAERVAEEFGTELGELVGYHVGSRGGGGGEPQKKSSRTALLFVTDGLLLHNQRQELGAMVIDEAHERGRDSDLLLARWRRKCLEGIAVPPLVVMSASINAQRFADYLQCEVVDIPGKMYDVEEHYVPLPAATDLDHKESEYVNAFCQHACDVLYDKIVGKAQQGDVLIFLPGKGEIQECIRLIKDRELANSTEEQAVPQPPKQGADRYQNRNDLAALQSQLADLSKQEFGLQNKVGGGSSKRQLRKRMAQLQKKKSEIKQKIWDLEQRSKFQREQDRNKHTHWTAKLQTSIWGAQELVDVYALYSAMPAHEQDMAIHSESRRNHKTRYVRKVVCCTNIAETSLTIDGVRFVMDAGLARQVKFDHELRCSSLCLVSTSQAAAVQRKGRAGRVASGWCYRLFSHEEFKQRPAFEDPEMLKVPVERLLLYLLHHRIGDIEDLGLLDAPPELAIRTAKQTLIDLGFLTPDGRSLTEDGLIAAQLDLQPWSSRMLLESGSLQCTGRSSVLAALLEETDVQWQLEHAEFFAPQGDPFSLLRLWDAYVGCGEKARDRKVWCERRQLSPEEFAAVQMRLERIQRVLRQNKRPGGGEGTDDAVTRAFVRGYFQFFAVHHDPRFPRAGYSVLTPLLRNDVGDAGYAGRKAAPTSVHSAHVAGGADVAAVTTVPVACKPGSETSVLSKKLLKVELSHCSTLHLQARQPAPWAIFTSLRTTSSKPPRTTMSVACAVEPAMVLQEAPRAGRDVFFCRSILTEVNWRC
ncbi:unnamed protein product [Polarella glacialis]|uniref:RNA-dependent RNA polymerase n=1 Tax=Polarella glacialis TaxID=89957 RepID=A0A813L7R4_POLGL|nr:unnamed protein product [Polarella glacialis]